MHGLVGSLSGICSSLSISIRAKNVGPVVCPHVVEVPTCSEGLVEGSDSRGPGQALTWMGSVELSPPGVYVTPLIIISPGILPP